MKSTSKLVAAAAVVGVLGFAVLPLASSAANTTNYGTTNVEVVIGDECNIGDGTGSAIGNGIGGSDPGGMNTLKLVLDLASKPSGQVSSNAASNTANEITSGDSFIQVVCNLPAGADPGEEYSWNLTERINQGSWTVNLVGITNGVPGFMPLTSGNAPANFGGTSGQNQWAMQYSSASTNTAGEGTVLATSWHAVQPFGGTPVVVAQGEATAGFDIIQTFGARYVDPLGNDTYRTQILYTLNGIDYSI